MSEISKQALKVDNSQSFPDNNAGAITPSDLRAFNVNMIDSLVDEIGYNVDSASWNNSVSALNTFTSSQQPAFTALNQFTASQLNINTGVNQFTQSATGRLNNLEQYTASFSTSVGIYDESTFVNNVNQIAFSGNGVSASFVSGKAVVSVNFTPLNQYTASNTATVSQLLDNFNTFTQSTDNSIALIEQVTASYATTGSNTFTENQNFAKNISVTQSVYVGANIYVNGGIEATYIKTIYETSSVIYSSGSNQLGDELLDTQILSGSTYVEGQLYVNKLNVTDQFLAINNFTASQLTINSGVNLFTQSTLLDLDSIHQTTQSLNDFTASQSVLNSGFTTTSSFNDYTASQSLLNGTFATTGSNRFVGQLSISSSATYDIDITGGMQATTTMRVTGSAGIASLSPNNIQYTNVTSSIISTLSKGVVSSTDSTGTPTTFKTIQISANPSITGAPSLSSITVPSILIASGSTPGAFIAPIQFQHIGNYTDGRVTVTTPLIATNNLTITGSVYGNVISQSIVSSTASIDLSRANFYTVALPTNTSTNLNVTNLGKGQTAMIQITSNTNASASFSTNVKQPSGFAYTPSSGSGDIDVLTLASFDGTTVLVTNVTKLI